jgi:hypothetical protein
LEGKEINGMSSKPQKVIMGSNEKNKIKLFNRSDIV